MPNRANRRTLPLAALRAGALLCVLAALPAGGAVYTITTLGEDDLANGNCTLREALLAASTDGSHDQCAGDAGPDEIVLAVAGAYELDDGDIASAGRGLTVRGAAGQPASAYVVDLGGAQRFLHVLSGSALTLENLTLIDGLASQRGGALLAEDSDLTLRRVAIAGSESANGGALSFVTFSERHLELEATAFSDNRALGNQAFGGAVEVNLQGAGSVRIVAASFEGNRIDSATGTFSRAGGGLSIQSFDGGAVELRHLRFTANVINAPSFARGAGAALAVSSPAPFELEDALFEGNRHAVEAATNGPAGLNLTLDAPAATVRRVRLLGNLGGVGRDQAVIQVQGATQAVVSDLLAAGGDGAGLFLATSGSLCSLLAGNLTVAGHPDSGLRLSESSGPLRVENSIVHGNATSSGTNVQVFTGTPEVSAETLVGIDPGFVDPAAGDYRLEADSVAAEAGDALADSVGPFDAGHGRRPLDAGLDLGALERGSIFADDLERGDPYAWSSGTGTSHL